MYSKKYWILMPPFFLLGLLLFLLLPVEKRAFIFLVPLIFWTVYYWMEHRGRKQKN